MTHKTNNPSIKIIQMLTTIVGFIYLFIYEINPNYTDQTGLEFSSLNLMRTMTRPSQPVYYLTFNSKMLNIYGLLVLAICMPNTSKYFYIHHQEAKLMSDS